jgi:hypothetical protein
MKTIMLALVLLIGVSQSGWAFGRLATGEVAKSTRTARWQPAVNPHLFSLMGERLNRSLVKRSILNSNSNRFGIAIVNTTNWATNSNQFVS